MKVLMEETNRVAIQFTDSLRVCIYNSKLGEERFCTSKIPKEMVYI